MKYEQLEIGAEYETREHELTREDIIAYGYAYDHQPLHMDPEFGRDSGFCDVIASGFQTIAVAWNLWLTHGVMETDGRGGISLDDCRWREPVFPGDRVRSLVKISELRVTKKGRGFMRMDFTVKNQHDQVVLEFSTCGLIARESETAAAPLVVRGRGTVRDEA